MSRSSAEQAKEMERSSHQERKKERKKEKGCSVQSMGLLGSCEWLAPPRHTHQCNLSVIVIVVISISSYYRLNTYTS
jgi:hypothetical protein